MANAVTGTLKALQAPNLGERWLVNHQKHTFAY